MFRIHPIACVVLLAATYVPSVLANDAAHTTADLQLQAPGERARTERSYLLSIRTSFGIGAGNPGLGGRAAVSGEYWLSKVLGVGIEGALLGQGMPFADDSAAGTVAVAGALRTAARHAYFIAALALGYARAQHVYGEGLCLDLSGAGCESRRIRHFSGYVVGGTFGWLAHPGDGAFEIGPILKLDVVVGPDDIVDYLATVNVAIGCALLR